MRMFKGREDFTIDSFDEFECTHFYNQKPHNLHRQNDVGNNPIKSHYRKDYRKGLLSCYTFEPSYTDKEYTSNLTRYNREQNGYKIWKSPSHNYNRYQFNDRSRKVDHNFNRNYNQTEYRSRREHSDRSDNNCKDKSNSSDFKARSEETSRNRSSTYKNNYILDRTSVLSSKPESNDKTDGNKKDLKCNNSGTPITKQSSLEVSSTESKTAINVVTNSIASIQQFSNKSKKNSCEEKTSNDKPTGKKKNDSRKEKINQSETILQLFTDTILNSEKETLNEAIPIKRNQANTAEKENNTKITIKEELSTIAPTNNNSADNKETDTANATDTPKVPKISLIPLSKLIRSELSHLCDSSLVVKEANPVESDSGPQLSYNKDCANPNLKLRQRKISTSTYSRNIADSLVEKVANMDKIGIKNVINSSGTKYDEALKMQARKRLHDEIRKQLKSMNLDAPKDNESTEFVPDNIVDAIHIPDVVVEEIRKAFGIEITDFTMPNETILDASKEPSTAVKTDKEPTSSLANEYNNEKETILTVSNAMVEQKSEDSKTSSKRSPNKAQLEADERTSTLAETSDNYSESKSSDVSDTYRKSESNSTNSTKTTNNLNPTKRHKNDKKRTRNPKKAKRCRFYKNSKSKQSNDVIIIQSSSSSNSSSSSSSASSSSSSSSSESDIDSNDVEENDASRQKIKQKIDADHIVASFEKLVLQCLSESLRLRYETRYSNSTYSKLHFISCICASDYNSEKISKIEIAKIQQNLKSSDKSIALEFLMREIVNVFNKQKSDARKKQISSKKQAILNNESNDDNRIESDLRKHTDEEAGQLVEAAIKSKSADAAGKSTSTTASSTVTTTTPPITTTSTKISNCVGVSEMQSTPTKHQSVNEQTSIEKNAGHAKVMSEINKSQTKTVAEIERQAKNAYACDDEQMNQCKINAAADVAGTMKWPTYSFADYVNSLGNLSNLNEISSSSYELAHHLSPIDLETLRQQSALGKVIVSNVREIDLKLIELNKRKMFIEEMLLRLQKDKMEVELHTIKLKNEKFILLNSATTAAAAGSFGGMTDLICKNIKTEDLCSNSMKSSAKLPRLHCVYDKDLQHRYSIFPSIKRNQNDIIGTETEPWSHVPIMSQSEPNKTTAKPKITKSNNCEIDLNTTNDFVQIPNGYFNGIKSPISQICVIDYLAIAGSEDGTLYKFDLKTLAMENQFNKHSEAITQIYICAEKKIIYTTSLDGYFKKTSIENFELDLQSSYLQEPLQSIDIQWGVAYIGSRWGNIFTYKVATNQMANDMLCSTDASITVIKAVKEGPRKVLLISSKGNVVQFRDATTGLLLRTLNVPEYLHIYSLLLDSGNIYCGTQQKEILKFDFTSGDQKSVLPCGNGAVSIKSYNNYLLVGCYDGYIYILDKKTEKQIGRYPGSGKMVLALEVIGNKIITSARNKTLMIMEFPNFDANINADTSIDSLS